MEPVRIAHGALEIRAHVQPQASKTEFAGIHGDRLKIRTQAVPEDGKANASIIKFLAKTAGVPKSQVFLLHGTTSRDKDFRIQYQENDTLPIEQRLARFLAAAGIPGPQ